MSDVEEAFGDELPQGADLQRFSVTVLDEDGHGTLLGTGCLWPSGRVAADLRGYGRRWFDSLTDLRHVAAVVEAGTEYDDVDVYLDFEDGDCAMHWGAHE